MRVDHRVLQLRTVPLDLRRHGDSGDFGQHLREAVAGFKPDQVIEAEGRHAGARCEPIGRGADRTADSQRGDRFAHLRDFGERRTAERQRSLRNRLATAQGSCFQARARCDFVVIATERAIRPTHFIDWPETAALAHVGSLASAKSPRHSEEEHHDDDRAFLPSPDPRQSSRRSGDAGFRRRHYAIDESARPAADSRAERGWIPPSAGYFLSRP